MKKLLITMALTASVCVSTYAQGTIDFRNRITGTLDVPVLAYGGATRLGDANYVAQLWYSSTQNGSYAAVSGAASVFRTGTGAGYWNAGTDSTRTLTGIAGGATAWLMVRVWSTAVAADYATALTTPGALHGESTPFSVATGGGGIPPASPAAMIGLTSFALVPEPATIALGALGLAGLLFIRRRK